MAKAPASDAIMESGRMKPLLALSKREPVQVAIALTSDGDALMLLDKKAKPRKVLAMLRADAAKAKLQLNGASLRFGRAEVDTDYDPGMVRLFVNKEAPGNMRMKLVELVKRIPYQKVEINVDAALEEESDDETTAEETAAVTPVAAPDSEAMKRALAALVGQIDAASGADTNRRATLAKLAGDANASIKAEDFPAAQDFITKLAAAIGTQTANAPARSAPTGAVQYAKCRLIWLSTRKKVEADIAKLSDAVRDAFADEGIGDALGGLFRSKVAPVMNGFDESLADTLDAAINQTDPAKHAVLVDEARQIIGRYQSFLASEALIAKLDENTLMPMAIAKTMSATLQALSASIR